MKTILLVATACLSMHVIAQTTHPVMLSSMHFVPNSLTIDVGDSVVFTNAEGISHNVNGTQTTFPSNPESFGNAVGTSWTYGHKFTIVGTYSYQCDVHATLMSGTITVVAGLGFDEKPDLVYSIYPNPVNSTLCIKINTGFLENRNVSIALFDIAGKQLIRIENVRNQTTLLPVDQLINGLYFCAIYDGEKLLATEKIVRY